MASIYQPPSGIPLQQCELLEDLVENRALAPAHHQEGEVRVQPFHMPLLMVMTNGCDLLYDQGARSTIGPEVKGENPEWEQDHHRIVPHVLLCQVFNKSNIKGLHIYLTNKKLEQVDKNQDQRLHHLPPSPVGPEREDLPDLYLDFKKYYGLPTQAVYDAIEAGSVTRRAVLIGEYRYDLMQRFYSYLARIGVPDTDDEAAQLDEASAAPGPARMIQP